MVCNFTAFHNNTDIMTRIMYQVIPFISSHRRTAGDEVKIHISKKMSLHLLCHPIEGSME